MSKSELARRLGGNQDSKRRWIQKLVKGAVPMPEQESLDALERAFELRAGYFVRPTAEQRREAAETVDTLRMRLEGLATTLETSMGEQKKMARQIGRLQSRVRTLEARPQAAPAAPTRRKAQPR